MWLIGATTATQQNLEMETNLVEQLANKEVMEGVAKNLVGEYAWLLVAAVVMLFLKDTVMNLVAGIGVCFGSHWRADEVLYISGRQARIVRVGVRTTTLYMSDRKSKMVVPNEKLKDLVVEKALPKNGGEPYLPKGGDPQFIGTMETPIEPEPQKVQVVEKPKRGRPRTRK
jgi:hypothetical protein